MKGLSIIITTYGTPDYLMDCLKSIVGQEKNVPIEVLVGIDGCEKTLEAIRSSEIKFSDVKYFYFDKNYGTYPIRNTLVDLVTFENILFFDSDDLMMSDMIDTLSKEFEGQELMTFNYVRFKNDNIKDYIPYPVQSVGQFMITKTLFNKYVGFQNWVCGADSEFLERLKFNNVKLKSCDYILFFKRLHNSSLTMDEKTCHGSSTRNKIARIIEDKKIDSDWSNPEKVVIENYTTSND